MFIVPHICSHTNLSATYGRKNPVLYRRERWWNRTDYSVFSSVAEVSAAESLFGVSEYLTSTTCGSFFPTINKTMNPTRGERI